MKAEHVVDATPMAQVVTNDMPMNKGPAHAEPVGTPVTVTTVTTTVNHTPVNTVTEGNKGVSITMMVFAGLGFLFGLAILIYAWVGLDLALALGDNFEALQKKCYESFDTEPLGVDSGYCEIKDGKTQVASFSCGARTCAGDLYCSSSGSCLSCPNAVCAVTELNCIGTKSEACTDTSPRQNSCVERCPNVNGGRLYVCGVPQQYGGCSLDTVEQMLEAARFVGMGGAITGTIVGVGAMVVAIPVLLNGVFGCLNNEIGSRVTGGFAIGMSVIGCCIGFACMIAMIAFTIIAQYVKGLTDVFKNLADYHEPCSSACYDSIYSQANTITHIANYYRAMSALCGIILFLQLLQMIMASVSCCVWKRKVAAQQ